MSISSALTNQNRVIRASGTTTVSANSATSIYLTLDGWVPFASLNRLKIQCNNNINVTVKVLSNSAAYRAAANAAKAAYIQKSTSGTVTNNNLILDFGGAYIEDEYKQGFLHLEIAGTITDGSVFTVTAEGNEQLPRSRADGDSTFIQNDRSLRVLRVTSAATTDLTEKLLRGVNPYGLGAPSEGIVYTVFSAAADRLYIGSSRPLTKILFSMPASSSQPAATTIVSEVWNGSTWVTQTIAANNTSDGQAVTPSTFSYSGVMTIGTPAAWVPTKIATDPLTVLETDILAGNAHPLGQMNNMARYWIRLGVSAPTGTFQLAAIRSLV